MNLNKKISDTAVRVGPVRFAYPHVFEPVKDDQDRESYSVCVIVPADNEEAIDLINKAIEKAKAIGKGSKWEGKIPANLKLPLRDGEEKDDPAFENAYFFNTKTYQKPGVAVKEGGIVTPIFDREDFYAGCTGAVTVNFYPYATRGNKGVGAGLQNIIKLADGERLGSTKTTIDADFDDLND